MRRHTAAECLRDFVAAARRSSGFVEGLITDLGKWRGRNIGSKSARIAFGQP